MVFKPSSALVEEDSSPPLNVIRHEEVSPLLLGDQAIDHQSEDEVAVDEERLAGRMLRDMGIDYEVLNVVVFDEIVKKKKAEKEGKKMKAEVKAEELAKKEKGKVLVATPSRGKSALSTRSKKTKGIVSFMPTRSSARLAAKRLQLMMREFTSNEDAHVEVSSDATDLNSSSLSIDMSLLLEQ
ncbi:hypothetical protein AMTR_s00063p00126090 [Amborella trichopoda]|uniref:Uncharacterized protein n=1 Tax=Amborella trichopoda TaxID=13333 RepID=U5D496_AMBTC|nr:hypothetical protein AMTR_s00063p00126090 [Amborella trichopoda]